ncbi:uncharacterized protein LOC118356219 [Zalophus californianus]|uniref:Uncharacterized protein LOC118356219 n=1 Tax=Zalophus californianus TaxID=9704 RepID=A0A6P9F1E2_ZALCA|nr:uncharacterized protein LOC118356219 [Zalophus californianus]
MNRTPSQIPDFPTRVVPACGTLTDSNRDGQGGRGSRQGGGPGRERGPRARQKTPSLSQRGRDHPLGKVQQTAPSWPGWEERGRGGKGPSSWLSIPLASTLPPSLPSALRCQPHRVTLGQLQAVLLPSGSQPAPTGDSCPLRLLPPSLALSPCFCPHIPTPSRCPTSPTPSPGDVGDLSRILEGTLSPLCHRQTSLQEEGPSSTAFSTPGAQTSKEKRAQERGRGQEAWAGGLGRRAGQDGWAREPSRGLCTSNQDISPKGPACLHYSLRALGDLAPAHLSSLGWSPPHSHSPPRPLHLSSLVSPARRAAFLTWHFVYPTSKQHSGLGCFLGLLIFSGGGGPRDF